MKQILEKLGLGGWEILFHVINLAILIVALYFLLYRPMIKKVIANRRKKLSEVYDENNRLREQSEELKQQYGEMKQQALKESAEMSERAAARSAEIIEEANRKADAIMENARKEAMAEKQRIRNDLHDSVGHIAVEIAEKILEREVSEEDNKRIIDESLSEWEK